jgi:hypothetical protein
MHNNACFSNVPKPQSNHRNDTVFHFIKYVFAFSPGCAASDNDFLQSVLMHSHEIPQILWFTFKLKLSLPFPNVILIDFRKPKFSISEKNQTENQFIPAVDRNLKLRQNPRNIFSPTSPHLIKRLSIRKRMKKNMRVKWTTITTLTRV